jgi:opacity protein-like surface antigen
MKQEKIIMPYATSKMKTMNLCLEQLYEETPMKRIAFGLLAAVLLSSSAVAADSAFTVVCTGVDTLAFERPLKGALYPEGIGPSKEEDGGWKQEYTLGDKGGVTLSCESKDGKVVTPAVSDKWNFCILNGDKLSCGYRDPIDANAK